MSSVHVRSSYFTGQYSRNKIFRDLITGLLAMRDAKSFSSESVNSSDYLPQFDSEPDHIYKTRVARSYLTNYWMRTIQSDSGKILANPISVKDESDSDLPDQYQEWLDDIDLEGKPLSVFAKDQLQAGQSKGLTLAFVDYLNDEQRPFVKEIDIDSVLAFKTNPRTGRLTYIRFQSSIIQDSEDEPMCEQSNVVFEIEPTKWAVFEDESSDASSDSGDIVRYRDSKKITDELPVSLLYTDKQGVMLADSPYRTLAEKTIEHFQLSSDIKNMMFFALQPLLAGINVPDDFAISALASYKMVKIPESSTGDKQPEIKWVQVDAAPIEQAREQIADIESQISAFGIDANGIRPSGNQTATAKAIDSAGSNAALKMFASGLAEHLERIIEIMSSYTLSPVSASVNIEPDFNLADNSEKSKDAITAYEKNLISGKAATDILIQNKLLPKTFDYELDQAMINEEIAREGTI